MNLSLHEKATFRAWAENMMGRTFGKADLTGPHRFNVKALLGRACMLKIEHVERDGKINARVTNLISPPEGLPEPTQVNECLYFTLDPAGFDRDVFNTLSSWAKEKIQKSETFSNLMATAQSRKTASDDPCIAMAEAQTTADLIDDEIQW
jgi:hypothetical protein